MRRFKTMPVTREERYDHELICDICGHTVKSIENNWAGGLYEDCRTEVTFQEGHSYPEAITGKKLEFDICPTCFKDKLIPWIQSQNPNVDVKPKDYDY